MVHHMVDGHMVGCRPWNRVPYDRIHRVHKAGCTDRISSNTEGRSRHADRTLGSVDYRAGNLQGDRRRCMYVSS